MEEKKTRESQLCEEKLRRKRERGMDKERVCVCEGERGWGRPERERVREREGSRYQLNRKRDRMIKEGKGQSIEWAALHRSHPEKKRGHSEVILTMEIS